jgi:hypothetical protein
MQNIIAINATKSLVECHVCSEVPSKAQCATAKRPVVGPMSCVFRAKQ